MYAGVPAKPGGLYTGGGGGGKARLPPWAAGGERELTRLSVIRLPSWEGAPPPSHTGGGGSELWWTVDRGGGLSWILRNEKFHQHSNLHQRVTIQL